MSIQSLQLLALFLNLSLSGPSERAGAAPNIADLKLADEAVIILVDDLNKGLNQPAAGHFLSPEKYEAIQNELDSLRKQANGEQPGVKHSHCKLMGLVDQGKLTLQAELGFRTTKPNSIVNVGFSDARLSTARLDGETPSWAEDTDKSLIEVAEPGEHVVVLEMILEVRDSGNEQSIFLQPPKAAITSLAMTITDRVSTFSVNNDSNGVDVQSLPDGRSRINADSLGSYDHLELRWRGASQGPINLAPRMAVECDNRITIEERAVISTLRLDLESRRGAVAMMNIALGPGEPARLSILDVKTEGADERVSHRFDEQRQILTLTFSPPLTPGDAARSVRIRTMQPHTALGGPARADPEGSKISMGRLEVLGPPGSTQSGTISFWNSTYAEVKLSPPELSRITLNGVSGPTQDQESFVAAYRFWEPLAGISAELRPLPPVLAVRFGHEFTIHRDGVFLEMGFDLQVARAGIREIRIPLPDEFRPSGVGPRSLVQSWDIDEAGSAVHIRLFPGRPPLKQRIFVTGGFTAGRNGEIKANLPTSVQVRSRDSSGQQPIVNTLGGTVRTHSLEETEVVVSAIQAGRWKLNGPRSKRGGARDSELLEFSPSSDVNPALEDDGQLSFRLGWKPRLVDLVETILVAHTAHRVRVEQRFHFPAKGWRPNRLYFDDIGRPAAQSEVYYSYKDTGGKLTRVRTEIESADSIHDAHVMLPDSIAAPITLHIVDMYSNRTSSLREGRDGEHLEMRLRAVRNSKGPSATAHVWATSDITLGFDSNWIEIPNELVDGYATAPQRSFRQSRPEPFIRIKRSQSAAVSERTPLNLEQGLITVRRLTDSRWAYAAQYRLTGIPESTLTIQLLGNEESLRLDRVSVNGSPTVADIQPVDEHNRHLAIPVEPSQLQQPMWLELEYERQVTTSAGASGRFAAPRIGDIDTMGTITWRIAARSGEIPVYWRVGYDSKTSWRQMGWLYPPRPILYSRSELSERSQNQTEPAHESFYEFSTWGEPSSLDLVMVSERMWLMICSLGVMVPGFIWVYLRPGRMMEFIAFLGIGCAILAVLNQNLLMALLFGAQYGLIVFGIMVIVAYLRSRRRSPRIFHTGSVPTKGRSSVLIPDRKGSSLARASRGQSTVDAPMGGQ